MIDSSNPLNTSTHHIAPANTPPSNAESRKYQAVVELQQYLSTVLQEHTVFGLIPTSGKVLVFDSELQVCLENLCFIVTLSWISGLLFCGINTLYYFLPTGEACFSWINSKCCKLSCRLE